MRKLAFSIVLFALCPLMLVAQAAMNNEAVIKMMKAGISDDLIIATVNSKPGNYNTTTDGIIALKSAGASDKVVAAIVSKGSGGGPSGSTTATPPTVTPASPASTPGVSSIGVTTPSNGPAGHKPRIAIMDFDYATVKTDAAAIFGSDADVGNGIARLLEETLVKDGRYTLIDRKAIETVMKEQNFSNSDRADPTNAAKIGRLLSVDAIMVGSITEFGNEKKDVGVGGGLVNWHGVGAGGFGKNKTKAHVGITAKLVNIDTGEILAVESAKGESARGGFSVGGGGGLWGRGGGGGQVNMGSSDFQNTIIGEATKSAVDNLTVSLAADSTKLTARTVVVEGIVAAVDGNQIVLNIGTRAGIKVGDQFNVLRVTNEIKDPTTGAVIRRLTNVVGVVKAADVDDASAVCTPVSGTDFKAGDRIKTVVQ